MKKVGIWIFVIGLAAVLLYLLFGKSKTGDAAGTTASAGIGSGIGGIPGSVGIADTLGGIFAELDPPTDCSGNCKFLCKSCPTFFSGRQKCRNNCESDCTRGKDYMTMYPDCSK